ncbi:alpha-2-macroglobulin family protein [Alloalcanivorax sp. C16-2]|uniref:alpha-2-macroglobulin family protein n=1 Tax=Alloalcanivorax sp. C16-2 TaxID=3390052 RepID=UPI003970DF08
MRLHHCGVLLFLALSLLACDPAPEAPDQQAAQPVPDAPADQAADTAPAPDPRWRDHLDSWPHGAVSARAPLVVRFTHPVVDESGLDKPVDGVARLAPEQSFEAVFTARDRLEIRPRQALPAGQTLQLTLFAQGLSGVDDGLPPLRADVTVMTQHLSLRVDALAPEPGDESAMRMSGALRTRDQADPAQAQSVLTARQGDRTLDIAWQHDAASLNHEFVISGIQRSDGAAPVILRWDGASLDVDDSGERSYPVPAPGEFRVTTARTLSYPEPQILVQFSEALMGTQNSAGLVTLNGKEARVRIDGSRLRVYPEDRDDLGDGRFRLRIEPGLRSASRARLDSAFEQELTLTVAKPGVRFVGEGVILPNGETLSVPFEAVAAKAVKVQAFEVFEDNIAAYLQNNELDAAYQDSRAGRYLWQKTLSLPPGTGDDWQRYRLDLSELMAGHPNGLIMLTLKLDGETIDYLCQGDGPRRVAELPDSYEGPGQAVDDQDRLSRYYRDAGYLRWSERDDPCSDAYYRYNDRAESSRAFLASNLGLIAKQGESDRLTVIATHLDDNTPATKVRVTVHNYQHQVLASGTTNNKGEVTLALDGAPFYLVARDNKDRGYLKLARNRALPTNQFNTGGERVRDGLKGFFYGERDVWRPGDDIHLTFILADPHNRLPDDHPVTLDWFDPRGDKVASYSSAEPVGQFHAFTLSTSEDAPTGNWRAVARVGERYFDTPLRVEAIKPNRLKIELDAPEPLKVGGDNPVTLHGQWLNGARAGGLKADVKARLVNAGAPFKGYDGFTFTDPTRNLGANDFTAFEGTLDAAGDARFPLQVPDITPPGMAAALLTSRVFEQSGDYSTQVKRLPVSPYAHWVGLRVPKGSGWGDSLGRDRDHEIGLLALDRDGKPEAGRDLTLSLYRIDWRWWWDRGGRDLTHFISDPHTEKLREESLVSDAQGRAQWTLAGADYEWGRYLLRVCQQDGRHCASQSVYLGWSGERNAQGDAATRLALSSDKDQYQVGETARVRVPASGQGRLLVSLETGDRVLDHYWVDDTGKEGESLTLDIPVTAEMAPNVYVHVALLQPHRGRDNDRPIRLYGIAPLMVEDPATRLVPEIRAPEEVKPDATLKVAVSEAKGRAMTYTLAVVDEGLLGITAFATPRPHDAFYQREALGVLTWDLFDQVVGAYGGELDQLLALGGSDALQDGEEQRRRRFPPVVRFAGPFQLKKGETREHDIDLPPYMGQVRVMVVAGNERAYGHAEQDVTVTQPLTLLSTLPRVLGPGETLDLPVTVFAAKDGLGKVAVSAEAQAPLTLTRDSASLNFTESGDQVAALSLKAGDATGIADVTVRARAGDHRAEETVHLPVRSANPPTVRDSGKLLEPGASWSLTHTPHGLPGTNESLLTVSSLPDMGLERRQEYLIEYPHGCIEQTVSGVLPQLYLSRLTTLSAEQQAAVQENVDAAIQRLRRFQRGGGFSYWPGGDSVTDWGTTYAGHFLLEARRQGYAVPADMLDAWRAYQSRVGQSPGRFPWQWAAQAYRLYTLALAGEPEVGAMNRLREAYQARAGEQSHGQASYRAGRWLLAAAYQQMGLTEVAGELLAAARDDAGDYLSPGPTYGSRLRDQAIALMVLDARGDSEAAWEQARVIASQLASRNWYSTQSTAWALMAMARFAGSAGGQGYDFAWRHDDGDWQAISSQSPVFRQALALGDRSAELAIRNDSERRLFVSVSTRGTPAAGQERAESHGLNLSARFRTLDGRELNPASLAQGTDFRATVTITNHSGQHLDNVALTQVIPSGWQIIDSRLAGDEQAEPVDYRDQRDDRVLSYFSLPAGKSRTYHLGLNATFAGRFYLPGWQVEAMYRGDIRARDQGRWVEVTRPAGAD